MKKKHIIALIIVSVSYLIIVLTLKYRYEYKKEHEICEGFTISSNKRAIKMAMKSDTDIFKVDDVSFDIYYGMYEEGDDSPESHYIRESNETPFFVLYIRRLDFNISGLIYEDYKSIEDHYLIKEISNIEAFSGEYAYVVEKNRIEYNHHEKITITEEMFNRPKDTIVIDIVGYVPLEDGTYRLSKNTGIILEYEYTNSDTVRIKYIYD